MSPAPNVRMQHPVCLIENQEGNKLTINQEAAQILQNITNPVVVVAIVGKYRTGKSYLMNKLAGSNDGFALGSSIQSKTKGIWMWCVPHPHKHGHTLVLLDTEGLGDVEKGDSKNDAWIFSLAVLLSSTLVYNSIGTIDQDSVEKLHYVTELTERIKLKASKNDDEDDETAEFKRSFPSFIWCVRDFTLKLEQEGKPITQDEYLQNALMLKKGMSKKVQDYNFPRECINHFFHSHKCFVFERPASSSDLQHLEDIPETQLDPKFVDQANIFCNYVYSNSQTKSLAGGHTVTGRMLGNLTVTYVESIRSGSIPCMENAVLALSQIENTTAINEARSVYEEKMNQMVKTFPTETQEEFLQYKEQAENMAVKIFMDRSFKDDKRQYQAQLMKILQELFVKFKQHNEEASIKKCRELIRVLSVNLEEGGMENNEGFCKPGGHRLFLEEKQRLIDSYNNTPRKGIKATEVLQDFMESKKITEAAILQADKSLTQREKEIEEARIQREAEEQKHQLEMEKLKQEEKLREEQVRSFEQQAIMLKEKMEQERLQMLKENEWMIEEKLREKEKVKDHPHKVNMLDEQVQDLRNQNEQTSGNDWIIHGIGALAEVAALALPGVFGKVANIAASFIRKIF